MRRIWVFLLFAPFTPYGYGEEGNETNTWVIENVDIIDIRSGKVVPDRSVVFEGSSIVSVVAYEGSNSMRGEWREDSRLKYAPRVEVELWESLEKGYFEGIPDYKKMLQPHHQKAFQIAGKTHGAGVSIMAGSDPGEFGIIWGFSLHAELQYLVEAGLSEADTAINDAENRSLQIAASGGEETFA